MSAKQRLSLALGNLTAAALIPLAAEPEPEPDVADNDSDDGADTSSEATYNEKDLLDLDEEEEEIVEDVELVQNTYQLEPDSATRFEPRVIQYLMQKILSEVLASHAYDKTECVTWCKQIADETKGAVTDLSLSRYKICILVTITERKGQGIAMAHRRLWDVIHDHCVSAMYSNATMHAHTICFVTYTY